MAINLKKGNQGKVKDQYFDEKVREIHEKLSKAGKNSIDLANVLENVDIAHCTADKLESGKHFRSGKSQGKLKLKHDSHPDITAHSA